MEAIHNLTIISKTCRMYQPMIRWIVFSRMSISSTQILTLSMSYNLLLMIKMMSFTTPTIQTTIILMTLIIYKRLMTLIITFLIEILSIFLLKPSIFPNSLQNSCMILRPLSIPFISVSIPLSISKTVRIIRTPQYISKKYIKMIRIANTKTIPKGNTSGRIQIK